MKIKPVKLGAIEPEQAVFIGAKPKLALGIFVNGIDSIARQAILDGVLLKLLAVVGPDAGINGPDPTSPALFITLRS